MILDRIIRPRAEAIDSARLAELLRAGSGTSSGVSVTHDSAMRASAVYACVKVISESVAQLPLILYRRTTANGRTGKERATDHHLSKIISAKPNHLQTSFGMREMMTAHTCLRGNSYALINRVGRGRVAELLPIHPDQATVTLDNSGNRKYEIKTTGGGVRHLSQQDVFHLPGMTLNGWQGVSVLTYARETIGMAQATEKHGAKLFANGAKMGGILSYPGKFKEAETGRKVGASFDDATSGDNAHKTIVLEEGMKWEKVTMTSNDAQFLETRKFQIPEIARFFRMPLHKIQDMSASTNNNIEHQAIEFVVDTLGPWLARWEQTLNTSLLTEKEQDEYYFEFLVDGLLRGDIKSRYEAYSRGILSGFMTRNEVRARENLNWLEGLDEPLYPTNMALANMDQPAATAGGTNG